MAARKKKARRKKARKARRKGEQENPDRPARPKPGPASYRPQRRIRIFPTMWWSSFAMKRRLPSAPSDLPRRPPPNRRRIFTQRGSLEIRHQVHALAVSPAGGRDQIPCRGGRNAAVRAAAGAVCEAGNGYRFHPERFCAGGAEVGRGRQEDCHGAEAAESGVGRLRGAAARCPAMPAASPAGSRNFEPSQGYLHCDAPNGIGAAEVWGLAGPRAAASPSAISKAIEIGSMRICRAAFHCSAARVIDDLGWRNHGTAVLGEMISIYPTQGGLRRHRHQAKGACIPRSSMACSTRPAPSAIAAAQLKEGDVMLDRTACAGPDRKLRRDAVLVTTSFTAIMAAVEQRASRWSRPPATATRTSIAAIYNNTGLQKDSGAIVVGAGVPPTNDVDFDGFGTGCRPTPRSAFPGRAYSFRTTARSSTFRAGAGM